MKNISTRRYVSVLIYILIFTAAVSSAYAAPISDMKLREFFPKVEDLEGGAELWLNTGIRSKKEDNHTVYSTTYSFYSGKSKKLMNIIRKGEYETNIALYSFNNFVDASMYFRELTKDAPKNRSQQVKFGERGLFFLYPKSGYINDADFYLVFINKTFVVWMHANDGFALMDIANPVNDALSKYILDNTGMYLIKKLTIEAYAEGFARERKQLEFTTDYPASIKVSGKVFDKEITPLPVATVNILETGDSFFTNSEGYFEHTILLDGISDIELSTNFYLDMDQAEKMTRFDGGLLQSELTYNADGKNRTQIWKLETAGEKIFGTAYIKIKDKYRDYPLKGEIQKDNITITLDCGKAGSDFGCEQVFEGKYTGSGISGKWTGTGGGGIFSADGTVYQPAERKIILSADTGQIKTFSVDFEGRLQKSDDSLLNIGAGMDSNAMIFVKPFREKLALDPMYTISAKLVMTHLPDNQKGDISVFKYGLKTSGTQAYLADSRYAGQLYKSEEPYKFEMDITQQLLETGEPFVIGGVPEAGSYGNHMFASAKGQYDALKPYIVITEYRKEGEKTKNSRPFVFINKAKKSGDYIGSRNKPGADKTEDLCYDAVFSYPGGKLTDFELEITGDIRRKYNTNPLDIYPLVGFIKNKELLNKSDGSIDYLFEKSPEKLKICVNGNFEPDGKESISYKFFIDGRPVEGLIQ